MSVDGCCRSCTVELVTSLQIECATSPASDTSSRIRSARRSLLVIGGLGLTLIAGLVASEVWAGGFFNLGDDLPIAGMVDEETLARAESFEGEYVFAGGQKDRDGLDAAIETAVEALSPMVRNLGRERLQESNPIPQQLAIDVDGDRVQVLFDGKGYLTSLDGTQVKTESPQGDKVKVSHRMRGASLAENIDGIGGKRNNDFKLNADGTRLTMTVEITSGQLPVPVVYRLTYKRK
jgi:hypothetical protein